LGNGGFQIIFKKDATMTLGYRIQPTAVFSQRDHECLERIALLLKSHSIVVRWEDNRSKERASNLRVEGLQNVRDFCDLIERTDCKMYSLKWRDLLIMKAFYVIVDQKRQNSKEGRLQIIDLKYQLHGMEELQSVGSRLSRNEWETRHNFAHNASLDMSSDLMAEINTAYKEHQRVTRLSINNETLKPSGEYISGIIDGDGCISCEISIHPINTNIRPRFTLRVSFSAEQGSELLLEVIAYLFDAKPIIRPAWKGKAIVYSAASRAALLRILDHITRFPVVGKQPQSVMLRETLRLNTSTKRMTYKEACNHAKLIYDTSSPRGKRHKSLSEVCDALRLYFDEERGTGLKLSLEISKKHSLTHCENSGLS
jgi:hypothetical protein